MADSSLGRCLLKHRIHILADGCNARGSPSTRPLHIQNTQYIQNRMDQRPWSFTSLGRCMPEHNLFWTGGNNARDTPFRTPVAYWLAAHSWAVGCNARGSTPTRPLHLLHLSIPFQTAPTLVELAYLAVGLLRFTFSISGCYINDMRYHSEVTEENREIRSEGI